MTPPRSGGRGWSGSQGEVGMGEGLGPAARGKAGFWGSGHPPKIITGVIFRQCHASKAPAEAGIPFKPKAAW